MEPNELDKALHDDYMERKFQSRKADAIEDALSAIRSFRLKTDFANMR